MNENADVQPVPAEMNEPGPQRKFSKENKFKFQIKFDKGIVDKLTDYSFTADDAVKDVDKKNFIVIDIQNLSYYFEEEENSDIRTIDRSKLDNIFENL